MRVFRWVKCCGKSQFTGGGKETACPKCGKRVSLENEKYCIQYQHNHSQFIKSIGTKRDAEAYLSKIKLAQYSDSDLPQKEKPVSWVDAEKTLTEYNKLHLKETSQKYYAWQLKALSPIFGKKYLHEITKADVTNYQITRQKEVKAATVNHEVKTLKRIYNLYLDGDTTGEKLRNTANNIIRIKTLRESAQRKRFLTQEECRKLVESSEGNTRLLMQLALGTGLRFGNLIKLRYDQIQDGQIHLAGEEMKAGKEFVQPLPMALQEALQSHRRKQPILSPYVFTLDGQKPMLSVKRAFTAAVLKAGLKNVTFHDLRRTFASLMLQSGVDLSMLSEMLNHSDISITKKAYAHLTLESRANVIEMFDRKVMNK